MGCFDSIRLKCPECKTECEVQSKAGRCLLDDYTGDFDVPLVIAADVHGEFITCNGCGKPWVVQTDAPRLCLVQLVDELEEDEDE